jgi:hypothetical protein
MNKYVYGIAIFAILVAIYYWWSSSSTSKEGVTQTSPGKKVASSVKDMINQILSKQARFIQQLTQQ